MAPPHVHERLFHAIYYLSMLPTVDFKSPTNGNSASYPKCFFQSLAAVNFKLRNCLLRKVNFPKENSSNIDKGVICYFMNSEIELAQIGYIW